MAGAPFSFRRQRTMVTGMSPWAMTLLETEPSRMPFTAPRPCEPSTIRSVFSFFATARMVSATSPTSALSLSSSLARESERRASLSICSSDSSCSWRTAALPMRVSTPGKAGGSTASRLTFAGLASSRLRAMTTLTARKAMSLPSTATRLFIWGMSRLSKRKVSRRARGRCALLLHEGAFEHVLARHPDARRGGEAAAVEQAAKVRQHGLAAADHGAVVRGIQRLQAEDLHHPPAFHVARQPPAVILSVHLERLAGHGGEVVQPVRDHFAKQLMPGQLVDDVVAVGEVGGVAHAVAQDHALEALVGLRVLDHRQVRRQAGARADQVQVAARVQVMDEQGAGGLAADQDPVAGLDVLEPGGQPAVGHVDAEGLQLLLPVRAGDGVGAQQRLAGAVGAWHIQPEHDELAVVETEAVVAGGGEAEIVVRPVADIQHGFSAERGAHADPE